MQNIINIATLVNALATAVYAALTIFMLVELRKTRTQNTRPRLVLFSSTKTVRLILKSNEFMGFEADEKPEATLQPAMGEIPAPKFMWVQDWPTLKLKNVGLAPAINIVIKWEISGNKIDEIIKTRSYFYERGGKFIAKKDGRWLYFKDAMYNVSEHAPDRIPLCIASPQSEYTDEIKPPFAVAFQTFVNLFFQDLADIFSKKYRLTVTLTYHDLNNSLFKEKFDVEFDVIMTSHGAKNQPFAGSGGALNLYITVSPSH